jgi:ABC-type uncharacterized transport system ATPase subunit
VLRGGRHVLQNVVPSSYTNAEMVEAMVGRSVADLTRRTGSTALVEAEPTLELVDVDCHGDKGHLAVSGVNLTWAPASSSAWRAWPAAASASCARSCWDCGARTRGA